MTAKGPSSPGDFEVQTLRKKKHEGRNSLINLRRFTGAFMVSVKFLVAL